MKNRYFWIAVGTMAALLFAGGAFNETHGANLTIVDSDCTGWTIANDVATCVSTPVPPIPPTPPATCTAFPNVLNATAPRWGLAASLQSTSYGSFGSGATTVWMFTLTVPAGTPASTVVGRFALSEYQGPATPRQMTISSTPCDFRKVDHTGVNGPLQVSNGSTATIVYAVAATTTSGTAGLVAGHTYYVTARNWQLDPTPQNSCPQASCNALMNVVPAAP